MNISPQNSTIPEQIVYCHYPMPSPKRKAVRSNRTGDAKQRPPPPNRIADLLSHGKRPLRLTGPQGVFPEKREVRKNFTFASVSGSYLALAWLLYRISPEMQALFC